MHQAQHELDSVILVYHHMWHAQCRRCVRLDGAIRTASQARKCDADDSIFLVAQAAHHEEELYQPIASAIYEPVNQAARVLGFPLVYTMSCGMLFGDNVVLLLPVNVCLHSTSVFSRMLSLWLHKLAPTTSIQHVMSV